MLDALARYSGRLCGGGAGAAFIAGKIGRQFCHKLSCIPGAGSAPALFEGSPPKGSQASPIGVGASAYGAPHAAITEAREPVVVDGFGVPISWATGTVVVEFDADAYGTWFPLAATDPTGDGSPGRPGGLQSRGGKLEGNPKGLKLDALPALPVSALEL